MPLAGIASGFAGLLFGLPCIRICGFYLIVSTLVAQYFVYWVIVTYPYFIDYATSSLVTLPPGQYQLFGLDLQSNVGKYLITLSVVAGLTLLAANLARGAVGRSWIAVRDMESVAGAMGVRVVRAKLSAFFVSSFYLGVTGVLYAYCYLGQVDPGIFDLRRSFLVLFMINIGGLGSITGSLLGAAFVYYLLRDEPSMGLAPQIVERV
jgi:branched-chain amino acid transport system permease protein